MGIEAVQGLTRIAQANDILELLIRQIPFGWILIAQQHSDNLFSNFQNAFNNFIESGQAWTLLTGFILGYLFRSLTTY